jgi:hypothetical protein
MTLSPRRPGARSAAARRGLVCALAAAVLLPQAGAIASSPASSGPHASTSEAKATSGPDKLGHRKKKPITVTITPRFFGVHDASLSSLSRRGVGAIRLWDAGVRWEQLEPQPGVFDFSRLDQIVEQAHANHTEVTLVLAGTPAWADPKTVNQSPWDPPQVSAYQAFVAKVMQRYKRFDPNHTGHPYRGIANYQVWNEPNITTFWTGTLPQMAQLTRAAWQVRQQVDKGARLIAPSMVTRLGFERTGIKQFYSLRVGHKPVWKYVDAMAFSLYPVDVLPNGRAAGPEDMMDLVHATRALLSKDHVPARLPMWNSEINYGLPSGSNVGSPTPPISAGRQVAFVMRTYLLSAAAGLPRVFWYSYDFHADFANTFLTAASPAPAGTLTPAGRAFFRVQRWMKGTLVGTTHQRPCAKDRHGTYTCVVRYKKGTGRIYWNPRHTVRITTVKSAKSWENELGQTHRTKGHRKLKVGYAPVLVRSTH